MRQQAPADVNFDNLPEIRRWSLQIRLTAGQGLDAARRRAVRRGAPDARRVLGCGAP